MVQLAWNTQLIAGAATSTTVNGWACAASDVRTSAATAPATDLDPRILLSCSRVLERLPLAPFMRKAVRPRYRSTSKERRASIRPRPRLLDDRRPAFDVVAHEGREIGRTTGGRGGTFVRELLAHRRIVERSDDRRIEPGRDLRRQVGGAEQAEPGRRFESLHDLADRRQIGKRRLPLRAGHAIGTQLAGAHL